MDSFDKLRGFICDSPKGQVFDSLLAVELGIDVYQTFWAAHCDMNEGLTFEDLVVGFITDIYEHVGLDGDDIEALVSTVADG